MGAGLKWQSAKYVLCCRAYIAASENTLLGADRNAKGFNDGVDDVFATML
jgi:hypothetical protein